MSKDTLHDNLVLDFHKQLVCDVRVENFLDCDRSAVELTLVDHGKATLANLLAHLDIVH